MNLSDAQELLEKRVRIQNQRESVMVLLTVTEAQEIETWLSDLDILLSASLKEEEVTPKPKKKQSEPERAIVTESRPIKVVKRKKAAKKAKKKVLKSKTRKKAKKVVKKKKTAKKRGKK